METNGHKSNGNKPKRRENKLDPFGLNPRQKAAADNYISNGGNASKAYRDAGYSPKGADANAKRLTSNDRIRNYVREQMAKAAACADVSREAIMGQLARMASYDARDFLDPKTGEVDYPRMRRNNLTFLIEGVEQTTRTSTDKAGTTHSRVTMKYSLAKKMPAIEALMRAMGMEKELAKNPIDSARNALDQLKKEFPNLPEGKAEQIIAETHGVPIKELGLVG